MSFTPTLPEHWTFDRTQGWPDHMIIGARDAQGKLHGWVTVNMKTRMYVLGMGFGDGMEPEQRIAGRGWEQRLVDLAVQALKDAIKP